MLEFKCGIRDKLVKQQTLNPKKLLEITKTTATVQLYLIKTTQSCVCNPVKTTIETTLKLHLCYIYFGATK